jgi:hypothetical protein
VGNGVLRAGSIGVPRIRHRPSPDNESENVAAAGLDVRYLPTGSLMRRGADRALL